MAETELDEIVVAGSDVTVRKRLDRQRFKHLGVVYEIRSDRPDRIDVRIIDTVPASIPVGFHPRYYGANWAMGERTVVFEHELEPDAELVTLYGLGTGATESPEQFRTDPTVEIRPDGDVDFMRLDSPAGSAGDPVTSEGDAALGSSSISELADALETDELDQAIEPTRSAVVNSQREARDRLQTGGGELASGLGQTIEALQSILDKISTDSGDPLDSIETSRAIGFHLEAIRFHTAHLREDLGAVTPESETGEPATPTAQDASDADDPVGGSERSGSVESSAAQSRDVANQKPTAFNTLKTRVRPGQGLPLFWIVSLLGLGTLLLGSGMIGGIRQDRLLVLLGVVVTIGGAFGWMYPETKLPLPAFPIAIVLAGLAILLHPFLLGNPSSVFGIATVVAGILITTIPMLVENRRWQLLGLSGK